MYNPQWYKVNDTRYKLKILPSSDLIYTSLSLRHQVVRSKNWRGREAVQLQHCKHTWCTAQGPHGTALFDRKTEDISSFLLWNLCLSVEECKITNCPWNIYFIIMSEPQIFLSFRQWHRSFAYAEQPRFSK